WAMVMLVMVCSSIFASLLFAYFFLWTASPQAWPDAGPFAAWSQPLGNSVLLMAGSACVWAGSRALRRDRQSWLRAGLPAGCVLLAAVVAREALAHWHIGLRPQDSAYAAAVYAIVGLQGVLTLAAASMALFTTVRSWAGRLGPARR